MKKAQKGFKFWKFFIPMAFTFYLIVSSSLWYHLLHFLLSNSLVALLIPIWTFVFLSFHSNKIFNIRITQHGRQKLLFYSIFMTFITFYFSLLPNFKNIVVATTTPYEPPTPPPAALPCKCTACGYFSSSNCDNACSEWQSCKQVTCSASGCASNPNCYRCEVKNCFDVRPRIHLLTPYVAKGGKLTVSIYFECSEWNSRAKNLTLSLKIDERDWAECFLNNKGLMSDFGWNGDCDNKISGNCGRNNEWNCDSSATCKHSQYDLWVKSNFTTSSLNITFVCNLPNLLAGTHSLTVVTKIYRSEIELKPSFITFRVGEADGRKILEILEVPVKIIRRLLLSWQFLI